MQDKAVEPLSLRPVNDPLKKEQCYALTAPFRLGEHIDNDRMPAFCDSVSFTCACKRVRENVAELNAGSARDDIWTLRRDRQPSDILAPIQQILETLTRFHPQDFERTGRDVTHLIKHACAMLSDG